MQCKAATFEPGFIEHQCPNQAVHGKRYCHKCLTSGECLILIGCRGNDPDAPRLLKAEGWEYGFRSDQVPYAKPYFIDIHWRDYDWSSHLAIVNEYHPLIAMVADYERRSDKQRMWQQVADIEAVGVRPMVCPKFTGAVADIPDIAIVAISVPTVYAGYLPEPAELIGRDLHLLGGHPDQWIILMRRYQGAQVLSADCSAIFQKAQYGAFWSARHNTWRYVKNSFHTHSLTRMSARNFWRYLNNPPEFFVRQRGRLGNIGFELMPMLPGMAASGEGRLS